MSPNHHSYQILQKLSIPEAIQKIKNREIESKRFRSIMKLGECCVTCGLKRDYVALGRDKGGNLHWDLYAANGTLMTIDHILPKSKGGKNKMSNYQMMCSPCNHQKGNTLEESTESSENLNK